jgi:hypothetical protein
MEELLTTAEVAALLRTSEEWVRDHAGELGGIRLGRSSRAQLRFWPRKVAGYLERQSLEPPARRVKARPGPKRAPSGVDLLPLPQ